MTGLGRFWGRNGVFFFTVAACLGFLGLILPGNPLMRITRAPITAVDARVIVGPFPLQSDLRQLSDHGVRTVISLLDPRVPYEAVLLGQERRQCQALGLQMLNFP